MKPYREWCSCSASYGTTLDKLHCSTCGGLLGSTPYAELTKAFIELQQQHDKLKQEYDDYIDGKPGDWYIVILKKERDLLKSQAADKDFALRVACDELRRVREQCEKLKAERDNYALAMACALENGIYANKQAVKNEIERILSGKTQEGDGE